ncbi:hypothetical protein F2Q69_00015085 [Brassica cretica]|uniref:MATH domain-containing protein n=1 Tax=Brassica cretica TaxID=69181 RepID=A0A8S9QW86_BRACR|nr:hypothetical protein F2Q69_00015085 [Brassica cretica]
MEDHKPTSFMFEIDNLLEKEAVISSPHSQVEAANGMQTFIPKGNGIEDHLALYLYVANYGSLQLGWKRRAKFSFVLLNQSGKEFYKSTELCQVFCAQVPGWEVTGNETMDVGGLHVLYSQAFQVSWIFVRHPDTALNFRPKSHLVKTTYMNLLLKLIEKLDKLPHSFSETELSNTRTELVDLTQTGFKLDWLKEKLDVIYLERKKTADASRIQELEQHNKNLKAELNKEKIKSAASAAKVLWLEQTVSTLKTKPNKKLKLSPN